MELPVPPFITLERANVGLFCDSFPPVMDGVAVCMENYAYWMQKKVGGVCVITPNVPDTDYSKYDFKVYDYFSVPVPKRAPYVTGIAEIDPVWLPKNRLPTLSLTPAMPFSTHGTYRCTSSLSS